MGEVRRNNMVKKKKFIDKKTALNYEVVHRDQRDPLTADENAAQNLLKPIDVQQKKKVQFEEISEEEHRRRQYSAMKAALREEMSEYNFPTDGYDYNQHIREGGGGTFIEAPRAKEKLAADASFLKEEEGAEAEQQKPAVMLPSGLFASEVMMAAPVGAARNRLENEVLDLSLDPEVIAALDATTEDLEVGALEELLDDFVMTAQQEGENEDQDLDGMFETKDCFGNAMKVREYDSDEMCSDEFSDISGEADQDDLDERRTNYTMTTSRRERGEQGRMLDEHFEKFMEDEYDDEELGELEDEETMIGGDGSLSNARLAAALDEFIEDSAELDLKTMKEDKELSRPELKQMEEANNMETVVTTLEEAEEPEEQWDCETIVSTYSNLYNHPKALDQPRIRLSTKTGFAMDFLPDSMARKTKSIVDCVEEGEEEDEEDEGPVENKGVARRGESKEDKKARKKALKEEQRTRRAEKKDLKNEFKKESNLQKKEKIARGPQLKMRPIL